MSPEAVDDQTQDLYFFPLSFAQQRLWLFQQMQPDSCAYNIIGALRLTGELNADALQLAIADIVQRHEVLRTTFAPYQGEPSQWVHPEMTCLIERITAPDQALDLQLQFCRNRADALAEQVFDLSKGPLIRLQLIRLNDGEHVLLSSVHHIISDGWSVGVFVTELSAFYRSHVQDTEPELAELEIQYGDYALWQQEWFAGEVRQQQIDYWRGQLHDAPLLLTLPSDRPRPSELSYRGSTVLSELDAGCTEALRALAAAQGLTLNMVLLAAYFVLLYRCNGEQDILVGSPVANRNQREVEPLIGFFANTLVLRAKPNPTLSFLDFLQHIKQTALAAYAHQDCPFEQIIDELKPERNLSYSPLVQTVFTFQAKAEQQLQLPGLSIAQLQLHRHNAQFDLALMAAEQEQGIALEFSYANDLFEQATVELISDLFIEICAQAVARPELALAEIPLRAHLGRRALPVIVRDSGLQRPLNAAEAAFFEEYLAAYQTDMALPYGLAEQDQFAERSSAVCAVPDALQQSLLELCEGLAIDLNTVLTAAWALVLARYSDSNDVLFGLGMSGAVIESDASQVPLGRFTNTLPLRIDVDSSGQLGDFLSQLQGRMLELKNYRYAPLPSILKRQKRLTSAIRFDADSVTSDVKVSLQIHWRSNSGAMQAELTGNEDYNAPLLNTLAKQLLCVLEQMTSAETKLSDIDLITEADRQALLDRAYRDYQPFEFMPLMQRFRHCVRLYPDNTALVFESQGLTYRQLHHQAGVLAGELSALGLVAGDFVGLSLERSPAQVVAILAAFNLGLVYVPMDVALPKERVKFMAEDAGIKRLLTDPDKLHDYTFIGVPVSAVKLSTQASAQTSASSLAEDFWAAEPDSPAYVIYTSGSTGQPKGVLVSHGNMARLFSSAETLFDFGADDVWTLFHSFGFDFSVWEIWGALCYGGKLVVVPYWVSRSPEEFYHLLQTERVTVLNQTPSAFYQLIEHDKRQASRLSALKTVVFGGEKLDCGQLAPWFDKYQNSVQLVNMFGITETTVHVTFKALNPERLNPKVSNIGRPLADLLLLVLDRNGRLCPDGVPGELYVGGAGVCLGYLNRDELNAQRFVNLPYANDETIRFYRSGDSVRYLENGDLEYLGRLDQQVQFHGFRIELAEIEHALRQAPGIEQAVVLLTSDAARQQALRAYYRTVQAAQALPPGLLRERLEQTLPAYMIPSGFVCVERFPLTANGKLDSRALLAIDVTDVDQGDSVPENEIEQTVLEIWQQVLNQAQIGMLSSFFDLGGHSLNATQIVSRINQAFAVEMPIRTVFEQPTIRQQAEWVLAAQLQGLDQQEQDAMLAELMSLSDDEIASL